MKEKVLNILNSEAPDLEKYNELFLLYRGMPGKSEALVRYFNLQGFKTNTYNDLKYQIMKLLEITDFDIANFKTRAEATLYIDPADEEPVDEDPADEDPADEDTKGLKFRDEYPFLNSPDLPEEFKILAADKITAFKALQKGHAILQAAQDGSSDLSEEELASIAQDVVKADELNALIKEEFDHYQETGEVLGKHPIFKERNLKKKIEKMTGEQKSKRITNLNTYIRRDSKKLSEAKTKEEREKWTQKVQDWETELRLIEKSIN